MPDDQIAIRNDDSERASLPNARRRALRNHRYLLLLVILKAGCGGDDDGGGNGGSPGGIGLQPARPLAVRINGPSQITRSAAVQFTAVQSWSDGTTTDVTATAQWTSNNPSVLSINAGLATGVAVGAASLTVRVGQFDAVMKPVYVVPPTPEWNGTYTLTIGGGACSGTLPPELRQRVYTATVTQSGLSINVDIPKVGFFSGWIINPATNFYFWDAAPTGVTARLKRVAAVTVPRFQLPRYRRAAYLSFPTPFFEVLPDGTRLLISGTAVTTSSPSGFTGPLDGALTLYDSQGRTILAGCSSSSHVFTLQRK